MAFGWRVYLMCGCLWVSQAQAQPCATSPAELKQSPKLQTLIPLFSPSGAREFVNQTEGSYFRLGSSEQGFYIEFFTTGIFDLYGIHKKGPLKFCEQDQKLFIEGLGRREQVNLEGHTLRLGDGGPKQVFAPGPMPILMRRHFPEIERQLASDPSR